LWQRCNDHYSADVVGKATLAFYQQVRERYGAR